MSYRRMAQAVRRYFQNGGFMSDKDKSTKVKAGLSSKEDSYRMAKLLRAGNRELARQLNTKKSRRVR